MTWKDEIKRLWQGVGEESRVMSRETGGTSCREGARKGKKGFMYEGATPRKPVREKGEVRPGNFPVRRLLGDERFTQAVLEFLMTMSTGKLKKGCLDLRRERGGDGGGQASLGGLCGSRRCKEVPCI